MSVIRTLIVEMKEKRVANLQLHHLHLLLWFIIIVGIPKRLSYVGNCLMSTGLLTIVIV